MLKKDVALSSAETGYSDITARSSRVVIYMTLLTRNRIITGRQNFFSTGKKEWDIELRDYFLQRERMNVYGYKIQ